MTRNARLDVRASAHCAQPGRGMHNLAPWLPCGGSLVTDSGYNDVQLNSCVPMVYIKHVITLMLGKPLYRAIIKPLYRRAVFGLRGEAPRGQFPVTDLRP